MTDHTYVQPVNPCTRGESFCGQHGYDCPPPTTPAGQAPATDQTAEVARLHDELLASKAEIAKLRALLGKENQRANDAITREETTEQAAEEAQQEARRLGLMVDEYGAGASALTDKLRRVRDMHRETCPVAQGVILPPAASCSLCGVLDAPATAVLPAPADRPAVLREAADALDAYIARYRSPSIANWTGAVAFLRRMAVEAQQDEAHPPYDSWLVELQMDDGHWAVAYPTHDYDKALDRLTRRRTEHPDQQWRLVRETDTFTVVDPKPAAEAQQPTQRNIPCPDAFWRPRPHAPHNWQQGPDTQPVHCRGVDEAQQPKEARPCGPVPYECDAATGDPCADHERQQSHADNDHSLCRSVDCEVLRQS